ncbi:hypothetical protein [Lebetimonas sp. JS085]|uniref:hypothetical protein n=1 Tax=Lebetimonas sp. JS085 TaxID=931222 RepID=UPI0004650967|nr:hypothetical protein [Lebetimonas sp. JS085]
MRLKLKNIEFTLPNRLIDAVITDKISDPEIINAINTLLTKSKVINRLKNPERARAAKITKTKEKIQNAVNLLRLQGKPVNAYQVAKLSGVSYNTAKKRTNLIVFAN